VDISYHVVGTYETGSSFEDNGAVIHLADAQRAFDKRRQVSYFELKLRDPLSSGASALERGCTPVVRQSGGDG
jgi:ABC-type lipoprotein release transport system permease subunit